METFLELANFLDFQAGNGDRLCLGFGIEATVDINNPSTIILNDLFSAATKTLRLTPLTAESDAAWAEFAIQSHSNFATIWRTQLY